MGRVIKIRRPERKGGRCPPAVRVWMRRRQGCGTRVDDGDDADARGDGGVDDEAQLDTRNSRVGSVSSIAFRQGVEGRLESIPGVGHFGRWHCHRSGAP
jgi:hypothetical protein